MGLMCEDEDPAPVKHRLGWRARWWIFKLRMKEAWIRATAIFVYWRIRHKQRMGKTGIVGMTREQAERCRLINPDTDHEQYPLDTRLKINFGCKDAPEGQKLSEGELQVRSRKMLEALSTPRPEDPNPPDPLAIIERLKQDANH